VAAVGDVIDGRYLVRELLGRGGMAEVFRATDIATDRGVAIKVLRSAETGSVRRFDSEIDVMARLDHPGVVKLRGSGTHEGVPYLVLDLAEGPSLAGELAGGPLGVDRALAVGEQVADALSYAHRLGIVHRDVKPSNILFDDRGRARLADFGIARLAGTTSVTGTGQLIGSAPYMAPEQVTGEPAGPATDVYSLGLVVVECLTGRQCYPGSQVESVIARLHRRPSIPQELPGWLRDVLGAMTATEPIRRPEAAAVADALRRRDAEPAVAATVPLALHARTGVAPAGTVDPMVTAWDAAPADATAEFPAGTMLRTGALRLTSMRGARTIVGGALVFLVVALLLAWMVSGADRPASGRRDEPATTSSTSTVPTTVAPILPPPAEAPPAVGQDSGGGSGDGRSNGNGQGNGKGKKGG
jgi:eukaryotic-like serine/threonine-protein kinase